MLKSTFVDIADERVLRETRKYLSASKPSFYLPKSMGSRVLIPAFEDSLRFVIFFSPVKENQLLLLLLNHACSIMRCKKNSSQ